MECASLTCTDLLGTNHIIRLYRAAKAPAGTMTGDHISTDAGDLVIHPVNHAGMVTTWNGTLMVLKRNEPRQWRELCKGEHVIIVPPAIACR